MSSMQKRLSHSEDEVLTCSEARGTSWCLLTLTMTGDEEGDFPARPFAAVPRRLLALYFDWEGCHPTQPAWSPYWDSLSTCM